MKRLISLLAVVLVIALSVVPVFASDDGSSVAPVTVTTPVSVTVEDNTPVIVFGTDAGSAIRSAFVSAFTAIFGEYTPRTQTVTTYFADGTSVTSVEYVTGIAGLDFVWIACVVLFIVFIYCILRMIGGVLKWN